MPVRNPALTPNALIFQTFFVLSMDDEERRKRRRVAGLFIPGFFFLGLGIGIAVGMAFAGAAIGFGVGFITAALIRLSERT
jgi:membrane associated rhomboid family serine protease